MSPQPLVVDLAGHPFAVTLADGWGPATLLLAPVADALKLVEGGLVVEGVDRDGLASVAGFALDEAIVLRLGPQPPVGEDLYLAVTSLGVVWESRMVRGADPTWQGP
jgi:hypothetical protein